MNELLDVLRQAQKSCDFMNLPHNADAIERAIEEIIRQCAENRRLEAIIDVVMEYDSNLIDSLSPASTVRSEDDSV